ncbi:hypothetical protein [Vibrio brasiliensis]
MIELIKTLTSVGVFLFEWRVASGEWRVASGEWRVASGEWRVASNY